MSIIKNFFNPEPRRPAEILEHLEELPDQDETEIQETVDDSFLGTSHNFSVSGKEKEVQAIAVERHELQTAARQLAAALDRSGVPAQKTLSVASQCITRTVVVPFGPTPTKVVSNNEQRTLLRIRAYDVAAPVEVFLSTLPISGSFSGVATLDIPSSSIVIDGTMQYIEIATTGEIWAMLPSTAVASAVLSIVEEFVS